MVADDGLTVRWVPGKDRSGHLGNTVLYVDGEAYGKYEHTQYETALGPVAAGDTRRFSLVQYDAAGNAGPHSRVLCAVPTLVGQSRQQAAATLAAAGFTVGVVREEAVPSVAPGTVVGPRVVRLELESSAIDFVVAAGGSAVPAPQTKLVFSVAGSKRLALTKQTTIGARIKVSRPASATATLYGSKSTPLYTWRLRVKAGANVVGLRLPSQIRKPGAYQLTWIARSGTETIRRGVKVTLVGPKLAQVRPKRNEVEVVLAGEQPEKGALTPGLAGSDARVIAQATPDETFALAASRTRDISVVVVDVDAYGIGFVADLRTVFPSMRILAVSKSPSKRALAIRAGAVLAIPRATTAKQLAKAIASIASGG